MRVKGCKGCTVSGDFSKLMGLSYKKGEPKEGFLSRGTACGRAKTSYKAFLHSKSICECLLYSRGQG